MLPPEIAANLQALSSVLNASRDLSSLPELAALSDDILNGAGDDGAHMEEMMMAPVDPGTPLPLILSDGHENGSRGDNMAKKKRKLDQGMNEAVLPVSSHPVEVNKSLKGPEVKKHKEEKKKEKKKKEEKKQKKEDKEQRKKEKKEKEEEKKKKKKKEEKKEEEGRERDKKKEKKDKKKRKEISGT